MERSEVHSKKKKILTAYHYLIKIYNNNKHNMVVFYMIKKKVQLNPINKNKMNRNIKKMKNHLPP